MKISKQQLADIFDDAADFEGSNEDAFDARKALEAGTLEIEGYERVQWTKFDPKNKSTFPKCYPVLILTTYGGMEICTLFFDGKFQTGIGDSFAPEKITHWRPFQPPPVETAEKSDELFPTPPPRKEKCRKCKHWAMAKNPFGYGFGVCTIRSTNRNQFGFERRSANSAACHLYKTEEQEAHSMGISKMETPTGKASGK